MQTFLPYPDFGKSAYVLDYRRLGKQRVETFQIIRALNGETRGWRNHPAARMWDGYEDGLALYGLRMCQEWKRRGYKDTMTERFREMLTGKNLEEIALPSWIGDRDFHISHQSNLVRKLPEFYRPLFPDVPDNLEYVWPVQTAAA
jgi:hypothetical protein